MSIGMKVLSLLGRPSRLIWLGIGLSTLFWAGESIIHVHVLHEGTFRDQVLSPAPHEVWIRLTVAFLILMVCSTASSAIRRSKRTEIALRESESKYAALVEQANEGVTIIQDGRLVFFNEAIMKLLGYDRKHIADTYFLDMVAPESRELATHRYKKRMAGEEVPATYEIKIIAAGDIVKVIEISPSVIQYGGRPAHMAIVRDVTNRNAAETALRKSEEKYRTLFGSIAHPIFIFDQQTLKFCDCNTAVEELYGYSKSEICSIS